MLLNKIKNKELNKEIKSLELQKKSLNNLIAEINEKEDFAQSFAQNYFYRELLLRQVPLDYASSSYCLYRDVLMKYITASFQDLFIENVKKVGFFQGTEKKYGYFAMTCDAIKMNSKGNPILILSDPYKRIQTKPLLNTSVEVASCWLKRILIVKLLFQFGKREEYEVLNVKVLKYTKEGFINNNKETVINMEHSMFLPYSNIRGEIECQDAIEKIQNLAKKNLFYVERISKNELALRNQNEVAMVHYINNKLYLTCKRKKLSELDKMSLDAHDPNDVLYLSNFSFGDSLYEIIF